MSYPSPLHRYLGCFGYNDSPADLGEPSGFWSFNAIDDLWASFTVSEQLNRTFDLLGAPTYSAVLMDTDEQGAVLYHLLVLSVKPIYPRQSQILEDARAWLASHGLL